ncbi:glycosyltransferase, partial [Vibrio parahaemolyticus]|nr:glycosyltransferase [Vibrio parahaemolyticus]
MKKVSFVLLAYNQSVFIESAIRSALEQDYENIEYIFSDDCSND